VTMQVYGSHSGIAEHSGVLYCDAVLGSVAPDVSKHSQG
jgi:hypothetical protein